MLYMYTYIFVCGYVCICAHHKIELGKRIQLRGITNNFVLHTYTSKSEYNRVQNRKTKRYPV